MGKQVEKLKAKRRAERMNDPHEWAAEIENRADQRSLVGAMAFIICLVLGWFVYDLKKEVELMQAQILSLQASDMPVAYGTPAWHNQRPAPPPPEGYEVVDPEIEALVEKYAPD